MNYAMEEAKIIKGFNEKEIATYLILREEIKDKNIIPIVKKLCELDTTDKRGRGRPRKTEIGITPKSIQPKSSSDKEKSYIERGKKIRVRKLMESVWAKLPSSISSDKEGFAGYFAETPFNLKTWNKFLKEKQIEIDGDRNIDLFKTISSRIGNE